MFTINSKQKPANLCTHQLLKTQTSLARQNQVRGSPDWSPQQIPEQPELHIVRPCLKTKLLKLDLGFFLFLFLLFETGSHYVSLASLECRSG